MSACTQFLQLILCHIFSSSCVSSLIQLLQPIMAMFCLSIFVTQFLCIIMYQYVSSCFTIDVSSYSSNCLQLILRFIRCVKSSTLVSLPVPYSFSSCAKFCGSFLVSDFFLSHNYCVSPCTTIHAAYHMIYLVWLFLRQSCRF